MSVLIHKYNRLHKKTCHLLVVVFLLFVSNVACAQSSFPDIKNKRGDLVFISDSLGNKIPDFSYAGYMASESPIPLVEPKIFVPQQQGDATKIIQAAIDYVSQLKPNSSGFRGAVVLDKGIYEISGTLYINHAGVVLRGSGKNENESLLLGTGINREAIIKIAGFDDRKYIDTLTIQPNYTPLGTQKIQLVDASSLNVNDEIIIEQPLTNKWIEAVKMNFFGGETGWIGWKPRDWQMSWSRTITAIRGADVYLNAPLTMPLDKNFGNPRAILHTWQGRIEHVGIENLAIQSTYDKTNLKDEQHRWFGISMENVKNAWVRQVQFKHLAGGAVNLLNSSQQVTVEDCVATAPISEIAAFRRHTFYTEGQQTLFQRCYSEYGYHDFAVGGLGTTGPNAFVQCESYLPFNNSGTIGSWATGVLFDVVNIDGNALRFNNREQAGRGAGWTAANSVLWESSASRIDNYSPPTSNNWAFGVWGGILSGDGHWKDVNTHIFPRSLFYALLEKRLGQLPVNPYLLKIGTEPSTSPTIELAAKLTKEALNPHQNLLGWIDEVSKQNAIPVDTANLKSVDDLDWKNDDKSRNHAKITIINGWLTHDGNVVTGRQNRVSWWRGSLRNYDVNNAKPHITRFVPGKTGKGFTDDLKELVHNLAISNGAALEHNYGLWYERRMDDHQRTRRIDADVWPPFYEQPFARSGQGLAWDHLSKYDLTKFNAWYWNRLRQFAIIAGEYGIVLIQQHYFQHNILEAGAHWSSSPWRAANNVNDTGFPEPPPYAGDKRIFMAEQFYDISHQNRKSIHQGFIRKSLENFHNQSNVIHLTSAEYTGPLHFMEFWLDEVKKYKKEYTGNSIIGLSATKDVQDAILADANRENTVDIIDIRYWHFRSDGSVYAPQGGKNLAPRQHARKMKPGNESEPQVYRAVREYRQKYPNKAVLYSTKNASRYGWAVLMAGGSLASIPKINISGFFEALAKMKVNTNLDYKSPFWKLENSGESYLIYLNNTKTFELNLSANPGTFTLFWIDTKTGAVLYSNNIKGNQPHVLTAPDAYKNKLAVFIKKVKHEN